MMKAFKKAKVDLIDLDTVLRKSRNIQFKTCLVSGHNYNGLVETKIRSVQKCLDQSGFSKLKYHATSLQTVLKLIENDLNNFPLGYSYGINSDNPPILRLIFSNMLKVKRLNRKSFDGKLMKRISKGYETFFKLQNINSAEVNVGSQLEYCRN